MSSVVFAYLPALYAIETLVGCQTFGKRLFEHLKTRMVLASLHRPHQDVVTLREPDSDKNQHVHLAVRNTSPQRSSIQTTMSSKFPPQFEGQTEVLNQQMETMLRAYTVGAQSTWMEWIHLLELPTI
ncbi:hypothetical protein C8R43DRAFT_127085 [Mycena crocata]|nr:hypothetical protein C8R43DRAFT_127085 [Mycena crocata]